MNDAFAAKIRAVAVQAAAERHPDLPVICMVARTLNIALPIRRPPLTLDEEDAILAAIDGGATHRQVAPGFGISRYTVTDAVARARARHRRLRAHS